MSLTKPKISGEFALILLVATLLLGACSRTSAAGSDAAPQSAVTDTGPVTARVVTNEMSITFETLPEHAGTITFVARAYRA
jgi:hypothetical protein